MLVGRRLTARMIGGFTLNRDCYSPRCASHCCGPHIAKLDHDGFHPEFAWVQSVAEKIIEDRECFRPRSNRRPKRAAKRESNQGKVMFLFAFLIEITLTSFDWSLARERMGSRPYGRLRLWEWSKSHNSDRRQKIVSQFQGHNDNEREVSPLIPFHNL